jgi:ADP-ribose pyrophosphatase YjhB (NUDIX family)
VKIHPKKGDGGLKITILHPSKPTSIDTWRMPGEVATVVPGGALPYYLNGVAFKPWSGHPLTVKAWADVVGQKNLIEPQMQVLPGKKQASGVVIKESDGRIWLVHPTNEFGGYMATFPKGTLEAGLSLQANAIKEAFEESGLKVEITGFLGDFQRTTSVTRYYLAKRVGGNPADMAWESQAVSLVPVSMLSDVANSVSDVPLLKMIRSHCGWSVETNRLLTG